MTKSFGDLTVLDGFDLQVKRGRFTTLVGSSGCGKSTFFDVLTGVVPRDSGDIVWMGKEVPNLGKKAAYMQQKDLLLPWLSLIDNALIPARVSKRDNGAGERAIALFSRLGLEGFEHYLPRQVSGGMRQRCALVRTLMFEHDLVLLDEPLSALDAITRRSLQSLLVLLQSEFNKTILMITHDVEEALLLADEVIVLRAFPMTACETFVLDTPKPRRGDDPGILKTKEHILQVLESEHVNGTLLHPGFPHLCFSS